MNRSHPLPLNTSLCRCLLCKSFGLEPVTVSKSFGIQIVQCVSCGLIQSEYVSASALADYYRSFYRGTLSAEDIEILRRKSRAQADAQMAYIAPFVKDKALKNALDFGAADGELASRLKEISRTIYVTETDPQYVSLLKDLDELMFISDHELEDERYNDFFDFISISHVLEHLPDPSSAMDTFSRILKKDGLMFVDIPNEAEILLRYNFQAKGHLSFFTMDTFRSLVQNHGKFDILEINTCNHSVEAFIQSDFTLPEEHFRHRTPNGTVIRAMLQNIQPDHLPSRKMEDDLDYRILLNEYSRRILLLHHNLRDLQKESPISGNSIQRPSDPDSEQKKRFSNQVGHTSRKRLQVNIPSSPKKKSFSMDLDLNYFSHKMIHDESLEYGYYEPDTSRLIAALLQDGDWMVDVGAHIGYFSLLASMIVGDKGRVFSFEPIDDNLGLLRHHIELNRIQNIHVIKQVVGKETGLTTFYYNRDNDGGHALWDVGRHSFNKRSRSEPKPLQLPMTSLDEYFSSMDLSRLKIIKIDTEGNELNVLKGAKRIMEKCRVKCIACELNDFGLNQMGHSEIEMRDFMLTLGYERLIFLNGKLTPLRHDHYVKSDSVIEQYFIPREFFGENIPYLSES